MNRSIKCAVVLCALGFSMCAFAQSNTVNSDSERPWAKGVSEKDREAALALFREGNAALKESLFVEAANKYREALKIWDHPAIHYNLVLALLNLDQPVEVHEHLLKAIQYGAAPLDSDKYEQALRYKTLVEKELASVDIKCEIEGATVVMDGRQLFTAPGQYRGLVRSGPHTVVATKEGYLTNEVTKTLPGGETSKFDMKLFTSADLTQYRRRWSAAMPWGIVAGSAVVLGASAYAHMTAKNDYQSFDKGISTCGGCIPDKSLAESRKTADTLQTAAFVGYGVGAAALISGAVLVYMNRLQPYQVKPEDTQVDVTLAPILAPNGGGASALVHF